MTNLTSTNTTLSEQVVEYVNHLAATDAYIVSLTKILATFKTTCGTSKVKPKKPPRQLHNHQHPRRHGPTPTGGVKHTVGYMVQGTMTESTADPSAW